MKTSGAHMQGLHSTQVRHHTQIDLLTCRVCFVKHTMISIQVRYYTHLDLTTKRVCSVNQGRAASGGASAPEPPRAHWSGPELCGMRHEGSVMEKVAQWELPSLHFPPLFLSCPVGVRRLRG